MRLAKKISCLVLAFTLVLGVFAVPATPVQAASKAKVTKKVRMYMYDSNIDVDSSAISVEFANKGDKIKNLKTNSKDLVAIQTGKSASSYTDSKDTATIGLIAKKTGTYKVTFDVFPQSGKKKRSSHTVTVKVDNRPVVVKFAGKQVNGKDSVYTKKSKGKLSVKLLKGLKLRKIELGYYDKKGDWKTKTVKNNKNINLSAFFNYKYNDKYDDYWYNSSSSSLSSYTSVYVYYRDTWLNDKDDDGKPYEHSVSASIYRVK